MKVVVRKKAIHSVKAGDVVVINNLPHMVMIDNNFDRNNQCRLVNLSTGVILGAVFENYEKVENYLSTYNVVEVLNCDRYNIIIEQQNV